MDKDMDKGMTIPGPYGAFQAAWIKENNVRVGDKVKCTNYFNDEDRGFRGISVRCGEKNSKSYFIRDGAIGTILEFRPNSIIVNCGQKYNRNWSFPYFALVIIEQVKENSMRLTPEQVKAQATTPEKALAVSVKHWQENVAMTEEEAKELSMHAIIMDGNTCPVSSRNCGLCTHYGPCVKECVLAAAGEKCSKDGSLWGKARDAWDAYKAGTGSFADWTKSAVDMLELLKRLQKENCGKGKKCEKKAPEPTYSIGDRFEFAGEKHILIAIPNRGCNEVVLASLRSGHSSTIKVKNWNRITPSEMFGYIEYTRYWDSRKKEYTGEVLREFEVDGTFDPHSMKVKVNEKSPNLIGIQLVHETMWWFRTGEVEEFHRNLGKLIRNM